MSGENRTRCGTERGNVRLTVGQDACRINLARFHHRRMSAENVGGRLNMLVGGNTMKKMLAALSLSILMMLEPVLAEPPITSTDLQPADPAVVSEAPATEAPAT